MFEVLPLDIPDIKKIRFRRFGDERGYFAPVHSRKAFEAHGLAETFVEDYHSHSEKAGTIRGLHYQVPPFAQAKLVRVISGRVFDVAVDIRKSSQSFGRHVSVELGCGDDEWGEQLLIPQGFAHGFCVLEPDTQILYKVSDYYSPDHQHGILWNDPDLGIDWPVAELDVLLSAKDQKHPPLQQQVKLFA